MCIFDLSILELASLGWRQQHGYGTSFAGFIDVYLQAFGEVFVSAFVLTGLFLVVMSKFNQDVVARFD